jgi:gliding motility-associated-like protein
LGTNLLLFENPFADTLNPLKMFRIDANSLLFNNGTTNGLQDLVNKWGLDTTLELDGNPRIWCGAIDIGAFEFFTTPTKIISQPSDIRTVLGAQPVVLNVEAEGIDLIYCWIHNGESFFPMDQLTHNLTGTWADTGVYHVVVTGICFNDTSNFVRVDYDDWYLESGGECPNEESWTKVIFDEDNGYVVSWEFPVGNIGEIRYYRVKITDSEGRYVDKDSFYIKYSPIEITHSITLPNNPNCDNGAIQINIQDPNFYHFYWEHNGVFFDDIQSLNDLSIGDYTLFVERQDFRFCEGDTFNFRLVCDYQPQIKFKNTYISPNGDGINDFLWIDDIEFFPNNTVTVINSYGETIYSAKNYNNADVAWDGRNRSGRLVPDGVYYYVVEVNGMKTMAGWVLMKISD